MSMTSIYPEIFEIHRKRKNLKGIKGGREWMGSHNNRTIQGEGRYSCGNWNKSLKILFTAFLSSGTGRLILRKPYSFPGRKLFPKDRVQEKIDLTFLTRYEQEEKFCFARGSTQIEYFNYSMEFLLTQNIFRNHEYNCSYCPQQP